jgi:tryptophan synthase alpha chain
MELLRRVRARVSVPVVLGFGISSTRAAEEAATEADGLTIGSKLMQIVAKEGPKGAGRWLRELRTVLDREGSMKAGSRD